MATRKDVSSDAGVKTVSRCAYFHPETIEIIRRITPILYPKKSSAFVESACIEKAMRLGAVPGVELRRIETPGESLSVGLRDFLATEQTLLLRFENASKYAVFYLATETRIHLMESLTAFPRAPHGLFVPPQPGDFDRRSGKHYRLDATPEQDAAIHRGMELTGLNYSQFLSAAVREKAEALGLLAPGAVDVRPTTYPPAAVMFASRFVEEPARALIVGARSLRRRIEDGEKHEHQLVDEIRAVSARLARALLLISTVTDDQEKRSPA